MERHTVARFLPTRRLSNLVMKEPGNPVRASAAAVGSAMVRPHEPWVGIGSWDRTMEISVSRELVLVLSHHRQRFEDLSPSICLLEKVVEDACHDPRSYIWSTRLWSGRFIKERFAMPSERRCTHAQLPTLDLLMARGRYHAATADHDAAAAGS